MRFRIVMMRDGKLLAMFVVDTGEKELTTPYEK